MWRLHFLPYLGTCQKEGWGKVPHQPTHLVQVLGVLLHRQLDGGVLVPLRLVILLPEHVHAAPLGVRVQLWGRGGGEGNLPPGAVPGLGRHESKKSHAVPIHSGDVMKPTTHFTGFWKRKARKRMKQKKNNKELKPYSVFVL